MNGPLGQAVLYRAVKVDRVAIDPVITRHRRLWDDSVTGRCFTRRTAIYCPAQVLISFHSVFSRPYLSNGQAYVTVVV